MLGLAHRLVTRPAKRTCKPDRCRETLWWTLKLETGSGARIRLRTFWASAACSGPEDTLERATLTPAA
eukprot:2890636-Rhodomonas_salina.2